MSQPLYLTNAEEKRFRVLPSSLIEGWDVRGEPIVAVEDAEQLEIRREIFRKKDPEFQAFLQTLESFKEKGDAAQALSTIDHLPPRLTLGIFFTLGVQYLCDAIEALLGQIHDDADMEGLASLTAIRHALLEANAEPVSG